MAVESVETALKSESGFMGVNRRADKAGQVLHRQKLGSLLWWLGVAWVTQAAAGRWLCCCLAMFFAFFSSRSIHPSIHVSLELQASPEETRKQKLGMCGWTVWVVEGVSGCPLRGRSGYLLIGSVGWVGCVTCLLAPCCFSSAGLCSLRMLHGAWPHSRARTGPRFGSGLSFLA